MDPETQSVGLEDGPQNLNDLQNYLVHFNKEIEVVGDSATFPHNVSHILTQSSQPVFVTVPVSSDMSTPEEEQLPGISVMKKEPQEILGAVLSVGDGSLEDTSGHQLQIDSLNSNRVQGDTQLEAAIEAVNASIDILAEGSKTQDSEAAIINQSGQLAFAVSDGMIMLPMGDAQTLLAQSDSRLVQIVTVNGQPTLQLVDNQTVIRHAESNTDALSEGLTEDHSTPATTVTSMENPDAVSVLASIVANTNSVNQLQTVQLSQQDLHDSQLVALRASGDGSQPQLVAVQMDDQGMPISTNDAGLQMVTSGDGLQLLQGMSKNTGYQSVALVPSGDDNQSSEVNYVLIVNQAFDKTSSQGHIYDFGDNIRGEVIEELRDEDGTTKRLVRLNQILNKKPSGDLVAIPVGDQLMCSYCNYTSPKRYLLSRHMKSHSEDRPHKCNMCDRGFKTMASLQNHVNTHTGLRPHKCKLCESAFTTSGELVRHMRYKHTFEKPHKCTQCDYASVELSKLKRHLRSHTGERPYACLHCNYASPDTYKLKRHMRIHTGEKPYECDVCHAKFTQSNSLKAHRLIHSGNKPVFQCNLCPATCGRKTDLKIHMQKLHMSEQPLKCKKCGAKFPDRYTFKLHCRSHDGEKCYKCTECDYAAMSQRHLETHMHLHTGVKPFECEDCDLAFRQKQLLKRHRNLYHNSEYVPPDPKNKGHECKECEKAFARRGNLMRHMQGSHDDDDGGMEESSQDMNDATAGLHTCGGCPKSLADSCVPLTADQLIENSLLADMKDGKLGTSPKVVVVHPDGRVEEVTARLQSLSQSKPMDDFLVSLGVNGEAHYDQLDGIPAEMCVSADTSPITSLTDTGAPASPISLNTPATTQDSHFTCEEDSPVDVVNMSEEDHTKEESTQASFDSEDEETKREVLQEIQFDMQGDNHEEYSYKVMSVDKTLYPNIMVLQPGTEHITSQGKRSLLDSSVILSAKKPKLHLSSPTE